MGRGPFFLHIGNLKGLSCSQFWRGIKSHPPNIHLVVNSGVFLPRRRHGLAKFFDDFCYILNSSDRKVDTGELFGMARSGGIIISIKVVLGLRLLKPHMLGHGSATMVYEWARNFTCQPSWGTVVRYEFIDLSNYWNHFISCDELDCGELIQIISQTEPNKKRMKIKNMMNQSCFFKRNAPIRREEGGTNKYLG
jgi:hypothetical protein